jgi:hypothetical protein
MGGSGGLEQRNSATRSGSSPLCHMRTSLLSGTGAATGARASAQGGNPTRRNCRYLPPSVLWAFPSVKSPRRSPRSPIRSTRRSASASDRSVRVPLADRPGAGEDRKTPAMQLGLAKGPVDVEKDHGLRPPGGPGVPLALTPAKVNALAVDSSRSMTRGKINGAELLDSTRLGEGSA